jgi:molybdopterin-binding protein
MKKTLKIILCLIGLFFSVFSKAVIISSNSGFVPNSEIQYNTFLEVVNTKLVIKFIITNKSVNALQLNMTSLSIPGNTALFFSTDKASLDSNNDEWCSDLIVGGSTGGRGVKIIESGKSTEAVLQVGDFYEKIYKKMETSNVYIYWGVTLEVVGVGKTPYEPLPRIGGMLTLPKGTRVVSIITTQANQ